jgi:hypothetical protein
MLMLIILAGTVVSGCGRGPAGAKGERGPPGPKGDPGPAGVGVRVIKAGCNERSCTLECSRDEMMLTAYCGSKRNPAVFPTERSATCRSQVPANSPLVAACAKMPPE